MSLVYEIEYTEKALKYLKSLERTESHRVYKKIQNIKDEPLHHLEKLTGVDLWKLRVGDYRIIVRMNKNEKKVTIVDIGHRRNVYKNL